MARVYFNFKRVLAREQAGRPWLRYCLGVPWEWIKGRGGHRLIPRIARWHASAKAAETVSRRPDYSAVDFCCQSHDDSDYSIYLCRLRGPWHVFWDIPHWKVREHARCEDTTVQGGRHGFQDRRCWNQGHWHHGGRIWRGRTSPWPSASASWLFFCKKKVGVGINIEYLYKRWSI